ncbi:hypothetical protein ATK86_5644 [Nocardia fluminea]|uniref:Uncharacterized protein n=1 Tax=Nocardia fluminea TaxID=134984 RepID=A0A2N3VHT8_9NOCA|nr:hypothetical protein ATK86_5644 [Nocardia fluminea]
MYLVGHFVGEVSDAVTIQDQSYRRRFMLVVGFRNGFYAENDVSRHLVEHALLDKVEMGVRLGRD